jgi:hypothetical protein
MEVRGREEEGKREGRGGKRKEGAPGERELY